MKLSCPAFEDGGNIPEKYGYTFENVNPLLRFEDVPSDAESLVLIMDDPDAVEPAGKVWDHWVVWNIDPDREEIKENETPSEAEEGLTDFGDTGYGGLNPPDKTHSYRFRLIAVSKELDLSPKSRKSKVLDALKGDKLEEDKLEGKFSPS